MKKTTNELLDDLLEDGAPAEFQAALLDKTLRSARRRKRVRRFNVTVSAMVVAGICVFSFWKMREPASLPAHVRQAEAMAVNSQSLLRLPPGQVVMTRASSVKEFFTSGPNCTEVATTGGSGRYQVIDDQQSLALLANKATVPTHPERVAQTVMVKKRSEGAVASQIAFRPEKPPLELRPNVQQCAVQKAHQRPKEHKQIKGTINPAADGNDEGRHDS